jgi:hypothetical protein
MPAAASNARLVYFNSRKGLSMAAAQTTNCTKLISGQVAVDWIWAWARTSHVEIPRSITKTDATTQNTGSQ